MLMTDNNITIGHGSGGALMHKLLEEVFMRAFHNPMLAQQGDAAVLDTLAGSLALTTDSYVVHPLFFPGGNIGKLAVCGTLNDLAVAGAKPLGLSASFILEEGLEMDVLRSVVDAMAAEAGKAGAPIITGDTKVVEKGKADQVFINTTGLGLVPAGRGHIAGMGSLQPGDVLIVSGTMGDHAVAVMSAREGLGWKSPVLSDCADLGPLIETLDHEMADIHAMRDITRGGLATVLTEIASRCRLGMEVLEAQIPVLQETLGFCDIMGMDPLHLANEGKALIAVSAGRADDVLRLLQRHPLGVMASIIGKVTGDHPGQVIMQTRIGGRRRLMPLPGTVLPRIC